MKDGFEHHSRTPKSHWAHLSKVVMAVAQTMSPHSKMAMSGEDGSGGEILISSFFFFAMMAHFLGSFLLIRSCKFFVGFNPPVLMVTDPFLNGSLIIN